ncbi:MAG: hypothetical protein K1X29_07895 [Bdellovibrionales bacterium]|nr:hypothetical protein [Bdellovibrionales bacterium]
MSQCPVCQHQLPDDFGLIDCEGCGQGLYIEFDGSVRLREEIKNEEINNEPPEREELKGLAEDPVEPSMLGSESLENSELNPSQIPNPVPENSAENWTIVGDQEVAAQKEVRVESSEAFNFSSQSLPEPELVPPFQFTEVATSSPNSLGELSDFANSEQSTARDGAYKYDIFISGLDSVDLKQEVKALLSDPLFLFNVESLMSDLHLGELKLPLILPVKAVLLIHRLKAIPVNIRWVQHAVVEL